MGADKGMEGRGKKIDGAGSEKSEGQRGESMKTIADQGVGGRGKKLKSAGFDECVRHREESKKMRTDQETEGRGKKRKNSSVDKSQKKITSFNDFLFKSKQGLR
jgi:hypothetical protein